MNFNLTGNYDEKGSLIVASKDFVRGAKKQDLK
jgi:hypothetical protein